MVEFHVNTIFSVTLYSSFCCLGRDDNLTSKNCSFRCDCQLFYSKVNENTEMLCFVFLCSMEQKNFSSVFLISASIPFILGRGKSGPSQRMSKSGRSSSLDGEHHDGYRREESFGGPPGGSNPSRGRSGSSWGRGSNMNSSQSRRGSSRGGGRGR